MPQNGRKEAQGMGLVSGDFHLEKPIDDKARESKTSNKDKERTIPFLLAPREFRGEIGLMRRTCLIDYCAFEIVDFAILVHLPAKAAEHNGQTEQSERGPGEYLGEDFARGFQVTPTYVLRAQSRFGRKVDATFLNLLVILGMGQILAIAPARLPQGDRDLFLDLSDS